MAERTGRVVEIERNFNTGFQVGQERNGGLSRLKIGTEDVFVGGNEINEVIFLISGSAGGASAGVGRTVTYDTVLVAGFNRLHYITFDK